RKTLAEMARVTRRWLVIDVRHKYTTRYLTRRLRKRLNMLRAVGYRFSRSALERELRDAGLRIVELFPSRRFLPWFSDKWFVLAEVTPPPPRPTARDAGGTSPQPSGSRDASRPTRGSWPPVEEALPAPRTGTPAAG